MSESILDMEDGLRHSYERKMETLHVLAESSFFTWAIILALSTFWHQSIETVDEFFHIQQAELYLQGRFSEWHPKITTPPGLYLVSLFYLGCLSLVGFLDQVKVADLRRTNAWAAASFPFICRSVLRGVVTEYDGLQLLDRTLPYLWSLAEINHTVLNICLFPPLFFFFGLYYTDVWSALSVLITIQYHQKMATKYLVLAGIVSLFFRQTNIFWVAIYLGGLEVARRLRRGRPGVEYVPSATWRAVVFGSWQNLCIYDPLVAQASFEDYVKTALSIVTASVGAIGILLPYLKPYIILLGAFGYFVLWNGGVVLGDKENHVPSLHLAQMLYIWPYVMFFSFPLLYPYFLNAVIPQGYIPSAFRIGSTRHQIPRLIVAIPIIAIMLAVVHFNTIVHPFTLADNRHYTFYVFRILLRHPANKYLAVPIYFLCAWAAITAFGGLPNVQTPPKKLPGDPDAPKRESPVRISSRPRLPPASKASADDRGHHVSTMLAWLLASTLSLVTAPLVEPRYFIVPWLVWRLHVASPWPTGGEAYKKRKKKIRTFKAWYKAVLYAQHDHRLWLETVWFLAVNWGVCYVFLNWGFEWQQEKGKVQRFMW
ncbi:MAG: hypothetical protein L6R38_005408 [Xanthoria sp. 2 TBL-2021]|nr:MAG: hypothetical protein L6R38_005408 [Xanthoria sp. 2 TBL-2021]